MKDLPPPAANYFVGVLYNIKSAWCKPSLLVNASMTKCAITLSLNFTDLTNQKRNVYFWTKLLHKYSAHPSIFNGKSDGKCITMTLLLLWAGLFSLVVFYIKSMSIWTFNFLWLMLMITNFTFHLVFIQFLLLSIQYQSQLSLNCLCLILKNNALESPV